MGEKMFCDINRIKEEKIAEGFFSEVSILYLKDGSKKVLKRFRDGIVRTEENRKRFVYKQIEIDDFDNILSQLAYLILRASLSNIELSFDVLFFKINLDNKFQDNLDVLIGDYDKVRLGYSEVDIYLNNHCAVWSGFRSFLKEFYKKNNYNIFKYELLLKLEIDLKKKVQALRGVE